MRRLIRTGRRAVNALLGRDVFVLPDIRVKKLRLGSAYGGWHVAVSGIDTNTIVYSAGVGEDVSFDVELIHRFGVTVHAFDPTPQSVQWVCRESLPSKFIFHAYGLADFDGEASFRPPENPAHVSHTLLERPATEAQAIRVPVKRLRTIMNELGHDRIDILKMDIEGAELKVLNDVLKSRIRPRQILVEFHHRFVGVGVRRTREVITDVRNNGYRLFSVSNTGEDLCFIDKS